LGELKEQFGSHSSVVSNYSGISAKELTELRKKMAAQGIRLVVTKNTLVKKVLADLKIELDEAILDQPVIFAFGADEVEVSREIYAFAKEHENLEILGGIVDKETVDSAKINSLALLPSRDELQAKLVGILAGPTYGLVNVLHANIRGLVSVLRQYHKQKI